MAKFIIGILEKNANQEFANLLSQKTGDRRLGFDPTIFHPEHVSEFNFLRILETFNKGTSAKASV